MTRRFPAWLAGAVALVALGPGALGAGTAEFALQLAQLAANGAPGIVTTVSLGKSPDGQSIAVTPFAGDDLSLSVKTRRRCARRDGG